MSHTATAPADYDQFMKVMQHPVTDAALGALLIEGAAAAGMAAGDGLNNIYLADPHTIIFTAENVMGVAPAIMPAGALFGIGASLAVAAERAWDRHNRVGAGALWLSSLAFYGAGGGYLGAELAIATNPHPPTDLKTSWALGVATLVGLFGGAMDTIHAVTRQKP